MKSLVVALAFASLPALAAEQDLQKTAITVKVSNIPDAEGQICVSLHKGRLNRPGAKDKNTQTQCLPSAKEGVTVEFKDLAVGKYAISAFHDRNGDGKLNHRVGGPRREALTYLGNDNATVWDAKLKELEKEYTGAENTVELSLHLRTKADLKAVKTGKSEAKGTEQPLLDGKPAQTPTPSK